MAGEHVLEVTDANIEELIAGDLPVLVDFWAEWCGPCKMLAPTIDKVAAQFAGKAKVGKMDTDSNRDAAVKYEITAIPTVILFKGGQVVEKIQGVNAEAVYAKAIENAMK